MITLGIFLILVAALGTSWLFGKNQWRAPLLEVGFTIINEKNILKSSRPRASIVLWFLYIAGTVIIYYKYPSLWLLIIFICIGLWVLTGTWGIFRASYSKKIRLLNYLYSPYFWAWRRARGISPKFVCSVVSA